jgi:AraC-like DNA-binding protein
MKLNNNKEYDENEEEEDDEDTELTAEDDSASSATTEDFTSIERFIYELTSRKLFTDINFNRDALLDELHIQKRTFTKKFEAYTGNSFKEYITSLRLEYAAQLIKEHPEYTIEAIAMECGIASYVTFHRNFTRHFGIAPSSYRQQ